MIRVLVVDDHQLVRNGFCQLLDLAADIAIAGEAESGEEGIEKALELKPDVILMDIQMPGIGGIEATRKIRQQLPDSQVVILSSVETDPFPEHTRHAGAIGFLSKRCTQEELCKAVRDAYLGLPYISADIAQRLALSKLNGSNELESLSNRELQVLLLIVQGARNKEIAVDLHLSDKTISTYKKRLYSKLNVANDVELTHYALRNHLVTVT